MSSLFRRLLYASVVVGLVAGCSKGAASSQRSTPTSSTGLGTATPAGSGSGVPTTRAATESGNGGSGSAASGSAPEGGGGEAVAARFKDPTAGWLIDSPGQMTPGPDGSATYRGPHDYLAVVSLSGPTDAARVASAEAAGPIGSGYRLVSAPHAVSLGGVAATVFEYQADGRANPVTGKATVLRAVRLYTSRPGGVYRVEYGSTGAAADWDPQGATDNVTTFRVGP